jgi:hypothetical protein
MGRRAAVALYVLAMVGVVVGVDVLFLRMLFWERLIVNIGIVLVFVVVYFRFLKRPLASVVSRNPVSGSKVGRPVVCTRWVRGRMS